MSFENNNDNHKQKEGKSLYKFLDKQGFYLILLLCVSIVLATAVWVSRQEEKYYLSENPSGQLEDVEEKFNDVEITLVEEEPEEEELQETSNLGNDIEIVESEPRQKSLQQDTTSKMDTTEVEVIQEKEPQEKPQQQEEKKEEASTSTTSTSSQLVMIQPVMGKIGLGFAEDKLVYHKTLDQWSTHKGLDIHAEEGAPVRAVLDGEVVEVTNDTILGITIGIQHEGDLITRYSNLSTDAMVKVGQKVSKGQVISGVGRTAANKKLEGPLVHFQVLYDGKEVDPQLYLPRTD